MLGSCQPVVLLVYGISALRVNHNFGWICCITMNIPVVCCGQNGRAPLGQNGIMMSHCIGLKNIKIQLVLSSHAYNISLTLFSRCTSLIVIIEKYYLVNNMHEECLFIQVRYNTAISPVHVIPTLQTCRIVYYILLYKPNPLLYVFDLIN